MVDQVPDYEYVIEEENEEEKNNAGKGNKYRATRV
jgi:hypothetical protein